MSIHTLLKTHNVIVIHISVVCTKLIRQKLSYAPSHIVIGCKAHDGHVVTCIKGQKWVGHFSVRILCTWTVHSLCCVNVFAVCTINANQLDVI